MINYYIERILYVLLGSILYFIIPTLFSYTFKNSKSKSKEVYIETDSIYLNLSLPKSQWFNMGYWSSTANPNSNEDFPTAAANLARKLINTAGIKEGDKVVEVGFGNGDSVKLLAEEFKPSQIIGFTSLDDQLITASKRIASLPTSVRERTSIDLRVGDAANILSTLPPSSVDHVLALDCAYHFNTRQSFIETSHTVLKPNGILALTDLILTSPPSYLDSLLLRIIFYLAKVPHINIVTCSEYVKRLDPLYTSITFEDISPDVFPGFLNFLDRRDKEMGEKVFGGNWKGLMWYGKIVRWYSGGGKSGKQRLRFILVTGKKKDLDRAGRKIEKKVY